MKKKDQPITKFSNNQEKLENAVNAIPGSSQNQNQGHNTQKEALGLNTKR